MDINEEVYEKLTEDQKAIIKYIYENGYITNLLSREYLGYGKTKTAKLFKELVRLQIIKQLGLGCKIYYILKD